MVSVAPSDLLAGLNPAQRDAATIVDGPAVVFAGAGSGKTRIITTRIACLIEGGTPPWEILAVTFTNKAAAEMRERAVRLCRAAERSTITTFHAACARWLREFAPELGFTSDFTIYDESDSLSLIKKIIKGANYPIDKDTTPAEFRAGIGQAKTLGLFPSDSQANQGLFASFMPNFGVEIYRAYQEALAMANAMDFGDLIANMILLLRTNERVRRALQHRYRYILVDEYQDTNRPQMELIGFLAALHHNIFVVGDDDQSIYSWRGAVPSNILEFDTIYPEAKICKLEQNYRCTAHIVDAAAGLIAHNKRRADKTLRTENPDGDLIDFRYEVSSEMEAWWVAKSISDEISKFPLADVAVFYRTNSQSRLLEDALRREQIAYQIYGSARFYDRAEVKDILAYLRLLVNPRDDVSLLRILNVPARGIGDSAEEVIIQAAKIRGLSLYETIKQLAGEGVPRLSGKLSGFVELIQGLGVSLVDARLDRVVEVIAERIGYFAYLTKKFPEQASDKEDNVMELASALSEYASIEPNAKIADWLQSVSLASDVTGDGNGVTMMTLHMAKGLEFERVYLVGLEEGLLPHFNSEDDLQKLEEERRLLYVGMTRAKKKLSLLAAQTRVNWGQYVSNSVSRFLREIPNKHLNVLSDVDNEQEVEAPRVKSPIADEDGQYYDYGDESSEDMVEPGAHVYHPTYGSGIVETIEMNWGKPKVVVRFQDFGLRRVDGRHLEVSR